MILDRNRRLHRAIGRYRLMWGFCPRCNSDAPAVYSCSVCKQVYEPGAMTTVKNQRQCPLNQATKALWWFTWMHPCFARAQSEWEKQWELLMLDRTAIRPVEAAAIRNLK